jgi:hypothetical protein
LAAKAQRVGRREATNGLDSLPDQVARPFRTLVVEDDARSDPDALRPPMLAWEIESAAP